MMPGNYRDTLQTAISVRQEELNRVATILAYNAENAKKSEDNSLE